MKKMTQPSQKLTLKEIAEEIKNKTTIGKTYWTEPIQSISQIICRTKVM